jgi:redox-sensitive bicupin YhaK (pirin superfamily)
VRLPEAPRVHVYVVGGSVDVAGDRATGVSRLGDGDALRVTDGVGVWLSVLEDSELLVWELY